MLRVEKTVGFARNLGFSRDNRLLSRLRPGYEKLLNLLTMGRGVPRTINQDETIRVSASHRYLSEDYEPGAYAFLKQHIRRGDVVLDVGAHVGMYSVLFGRWVGAKGQVYAFEPSPATVPLLMTHLRINDIESRVTVVATAMGQQIGEATFYTHGTHCQNTFCPTAPNLPSNRDETTVPIDTIDHFCGVRGLQPDWVKIDVEGYELPVLRGMIQILKYRPKLLVEMHPYAWRELGYDHRDLESFCNTYNLDPIPLSGQALPLQDYGDVYLRYKSS